MNNAPAPPADKTSPQTRPKVNSIAFMASTLLGVALCVYIAYPLFAPLLWAGVLAVMARPWHRWVERRVRHRSLAAGIVTAAVALLVALPVAFVASEMLVEATDAAARFRSGEAERLWQEFLSRHPQVHAVVTALERRVDVKGVTGDATTWVASALRRLLTGSLAAATGWLIMCFILFFFLRDHRAVLAALHRYLPLADGEVREILRTADDTIHATVWGTLGIALLQGVLGGLVFWWLGIPAPVLWGAVMALLSVLPVLGAAIVWLPVAAYLALQGNWVDAVTLAVFGTVVIGLVDNLVYPLIVKGRIRMHAVPVFVSIIGGLIVFGASGLILGPLLLALTDSMVTLWRRRLGMRTAPIVDEG
ncbi:MAG TPA: AI-2E family transporter [Caldimonas sp.]|jgi:predicted PurR-regulated permease PerM|nr:AI-2E family transporter [Caldimonas sp.]HEX2542031.1 AI-2E family transporter [Caldimonas sp.]